ncbi:MAG: branched-chain amino acid ABC transporter permease [marine bacterium B5-7]|nr:MAG: branched-chain amino acid ABC transporter permease [marine bacterium B5-7]
MKDSLRRLSLNGWVMLVSIVLLALAPTITTWMDDPFLLDLIMRMVILSIAAVSLNLILGYGGMISFGHAAYIGIGAYSVGIPAYYEIHSGLFQLGVTVVVCALFAFITGYICLRTKGVYFIMITLAFAQMIFFALVSIEEYGGDDGLVIYQRSTFEFGPDLGSDISLYYTCVVVLTLALLIVHKIVNSRFGLVIRGSAGNDARLMSLGIPTFRYRLVCYVIAGVICGVAGWLLGNFTNFISPEMMDWTRSGELIFMVVLGGAGSLFGPVLGAVAYLTIEEVLSGITIYWQLPFGILLVLVVLFGKGGLTGLIAKIGRGDK